MPGGRNGATRHHRSAATTRFLPHGSLAFGMRSRESAVKESANVMINATGLSRHARTFSSLRLLSR